MLKADQFTHCWIDTTYIFISKAFYFIFILTFFSISCNNNDPSNQAFCTCQNCFCAISSISLQNKDILFLSLCNTAGFNLHLLVYAFIYKFYTRITALVESTFINPVKLFIFISFPNTCFETVCYLKQEVSFVSYLFWFTAKWHLNW